MPVDDHANFAVSQVATAPVPASSGTSLAVAAGQGTRFPTPPFNATVWPAGATPVPTNAEIVRVTARATDTLTITRLQEGTAARPIGVGDSIAATITDKTLTDIEGILPATALTPGAVVFAGVAGALAQDPGNLFFDDTLNNLRLFGGGVGASGAGVLALGPGTAPTTSPVDTAQLYTVDIAAAGTRGLAIRDEWGGILKVGTHSDDYTVLRLAAPGGADNVEMSCGVAWGGIGTGLGELSLWTNGATKWVIETTGALYPTADITYNVGRTDRRVGNLYVQNLSVWGTSSLSIPNTRVTYGGPGGELTTSSNLYFDGSTFTANAINTNSQNCWGQMNAGSYVGGPMSIGGNGVVCGPVDASGRIYSAQHGHFATGLYLPYIPGGYVAYSSGGWLTGSVSFTTDGNTVAMGYLNCVGRAGIGQNNEGASTFAVTGNVAYTHTVFIHSRTDGGGYGLIVDHGVTGGAGGSGTILLLRNGAGVQQMTVTDQLTNPVNMLVDGLFRNIRCGGANSAGSGWRYLMIAN